MSDINAIPPPHRIIVARVPDGWLCVLQPGIDIMGSPSDWFQARQNAELYHADPDTCEIVDVRDPQWRKVRDDTHRMLWRVARAQRESGDAS